MWVSRVRSPDDSPKTLYPIAHHDFQYLDNTIQIFPYDAGLNRLSSIDRLAQKGSGLHFTLYDFLLSSRMYLCLGPDEFITKALFITSPLEETSAARLLLMTGIEFNF